MIDFDSLYREFAPRVYRFVLGLSGDQWPRTSPPRRSCGCGPRATACGTRPCAFLFTIARNLWLQGIRSKWRHGDSTRGCGSLARP